MTLANSYCALQTSLLLFLFAGTTTVQPAFLVQQQLQGSVTSLLAAAQPSL
jgi:hypothetical protein